MFAGLNLLCIPITFLFYPERAHCSLEAIDAMFSTNRPLYRKIEAVYIAAANGDVLTARGLSVSSHDTRPMRTDRYRTPRRSKKENGAGNSDVIIANE